MNTDMKGMIRRAFFINADARSGIRQSRRFLNALAALVRVLATFSAGAQTLQWWAEPGMQHD
jgi:hypothetical protein